MAIPNKFRQGSVKVDFSLAEFSTSAFDIFLTSSPEEHPASGNSYYIQLFDWRNSGYCGIYAVRNGVHRLVKMIENLQQMQKDVWHTAEIEVTGNKVILALDGKEFYSSNKPADLGLGGIALGAKFGRVCIDNVCISK